MAKPFDPQRLLKHISNLLLKEFFVDHCGELEELSWCDLTEHEIEPVFEAWQALPEQRRCEVLDILRDVSELAGHRGRAVLAEEILWRYPERAMEFRGMTSKADSAMWAYLNAREAFEEAAVFARADALSSGRYWKRRSGLPRKPLVVDQVMLKKLGLALTAFYEQAQMRGGHCHVDHYRRGSSIDYFFAYLEDYPDKRLAFDGDGHQPVIISDRRAFGNVFVYDGADGVLEVSAPGGNKVWGPLQSVFCQTVLGVAVDPVDSARPCFLLDHLLAPDFPLPTDPGDGIEEARITRLRLAPYGSGGHIEILADPKGPPNDIYRKLDRWLRAGSVTRADTRVLRATFHLKFQNDSRGRFSTLTFDVSAPDSCNLKGKHDEHQQVGERCLKLWGVVAGDEDKRRPSCIGPDRSGRGRASVQPCGDHGLAA